jgi:HEAT repeat protein
MKKLMAVILAAGAAPFAAGCVEVDRQEFDDLKGKFENFQIEAKNKNELQVHLYNELVQKHGALTKQVADLDVLLRTLQATASRLEDQVKVLAATPRPAGAQPGDAPTSVPSGPKEKIEDILLHIETTINQLRQGKIKAEEAASQLRPYAKDAAPRILDELAGAITKFDYSKQLESVLAKFPPADLKVPLQKALGQRGLRESAARVVGQTKDPELGKILEEYLEAPDEDFRLVVGEALVQCRNAKGIPILIITLKSGEVTTRTIAIAALKRLNRGEDFNYRAQQAPEQNAGAVKSWEEWAEKFGKTIFD